MGVFGGYHAARLFKALRGNSAVLQRKRLSIMVTTLFPGTAFSVFFVLNLMIWGQKSSGAVPFGTLFALLLIWVGSYFGFKKAPLEFPVRTNQIPRQVPVQPWYLSTGLSIIIGGVLPFGAVFVELFFILTSIWMHQFYYLFGFLALVLVILFITCGEITVVLCYFQLCAEDYRWWWRSFLTSGSCALYLLAY